jgi:ankyrin repeat protein
MLLDNGATVDATSARGSTPLHFASCIGDLEVARMLLNSGADCDLQTTHDGVSSMLTAVVNARPELVELLLLVGAKPECQDHDGCTPVYAAAEIGHLHILRALLAAGALVATPMTADGSFALYAACQGGHLEASKLLLAHGAVASTVLSSTGASTVHAAVGSGSAELVQLMLAHGASGCAQLAVGGTGGGSAALHKAAADGNEEIVTILLGAGAPVDPQLAGGSRPMHLAAEGAHHGVVELLLAAGGSPTLPNSEGSTPIAFAVQCGNVKVVRALLRAGANPCTRVFDLRVAESAREGPTLLFLAAECKDLATVRLLVATGAAVDATTLIAQQSPLQSAARSGQLAIVKLLLAAKATVDLATAQGRSALHFAAEGGHSDAVRSLLDAKADTAHTDEIQLTPLHCAAAKSRVQVVQMLLAAGAAPSPVTTNGETALAKAAAAGSTAVLSVLLAAGASPNTQSTDKSKASPLHAAVKSRSVACIRMLLAAGAAVDPRMFIPLDDECSLNVTPMQFALVNGQSYDAVHLLLSAGASVHGAITNDGKTVLHIACTPTEHHTLEENDAMFVALLAAGASPSQADDEGHTPLMECARWGRRQLVRQLLLAGVDPDGPPHSVSGLTPLLDAASNGHVDSAKLLVACGASRSKRLIGPDGSACARTLAVQSDTDGAKSLVVWLDSTLKWPALRVAASLHLHFEMKAALRNGFVDPDECVGHYALTVAEATGCSRSTAVVRLALGGWSPAAHWIHHIGVRTAVSCTLQVANRLRSPTSITIDAVQPQGRGSVRQPRPQAVAKGTPMLPPEMWLTILSFASRRSWSHW